MAAALIDPGEVEALRQRAWVHFRDHGQWPDRVPIFMELFDRGIDLDELLLDSPHLCIHDEGGDRKTVALTFQSMLSIPEIEDLLVPVPEALRLAAQRYIAAPTDIHSSGHNTRLTMKDLDQIWGDRRRAVLAVRVLACGSGPLRWNGMSGADEYTFDLDVRALCYEHVETTAEAFAIPTFFNGPELTGPLVGPYLAAVQAIHNFTKSALHWPAALKFAVDYRRLGFVPRLVSSLHPQYVRDSFGEHKYARLRLTSRSVPYLGLDREQMELLLATIRAVPQVYRTAGGGKQVRLTALAAELQKPPESLAPLCLLIEDEPWTRGGNPGNETVEWGVNVDEGVIRLKRVTSWEDYLSLRRRHFPSHLDDKPVGASYPPSHVVKELFPEPAEPQRPKPETMMLSTFISYGGPDTVFARRLYEALTAKGVKTFFFPKHAPPGMRLSQVMSDGVNQYDRILLICSEQSLVRSGVLNELEEALSREARQSGETCIIPLTIDDYVFRGWRPTQERVARAILGRVIADFRQAVTDPAAFAEELGRIIDVLRAT